MNLIATGLALASELKELSRRYDPRSDDHDILTYESIGIAELIYGMKEGKEPNEKWKESVLLGEWGKHTRQKIPEMTKKVEEFYFQYSDRNNNPAEQCASHNGGKPPRES